MEEIWKDIVDYEGLYEISNKGNVRRKNGKVLKPSNTLYLTIDLSKNGEHKRQAIHRIVATHFIPNPKPFVLLEVNHKDGNKHNNNIENLEWVSQIDNIRHSISVLNHHPFGKKPRQVAKIDIETNEVIETYGSVSEAGSQYGKPNARTYITNCCRGKVPTAYGYKWQYADGGK